ncbi:MAG: SAF domain-containing protein [Acidimicrobiales bacterium]|nr:SAF domain-containing protein [Acidimicrobiales bacterium]
MRLPPLRLVVVAVLALVVGLSVHRAVSSAAAAAAALGETRRVAVAQRFIAVGDEIQPADVSMVERPIAHVPDTAVVEDPTGRTVRVAVPAGEILITDRLAGEDRSGAAALVPAGWRAVAVPTIDAAAPVEPGDLVDVIASYDPSLTGTEPSQVIARDSVVVDVADDAVTVAVTPSRATAIAHALTNGVVTLALVG